MTETPYVLGTDDEEIARLQRQHEVWRPRVLDVWHRAGFGPGQTILDLGCGPGSAALDLAAMVGPTGRIIAIDRSRRFLDALVETARGRNLQNISVVEGDLDEVHLPSADGAWCRWAAAFVREPRNLMRRIACALRPNGTFVAHEYFDYGTWRMVPPLPELDEFVALVMAAWRHADGEPDIGLDLPAWLDELGFDVATRPLVDVIETTSPIWPWPRTFIASGLRRLTSLGRLSSARAHAIWRAYEAREHAPHARMITPAVLEIIGCRRT